ncbi:MAG TPA: phosphodiester glycosidase family protein [Petrotogaceae bacterium]|jgi:exopolysaccharide biosynthesis protein|nr:phosphodiester glycosidase family protein [Petrotogaceae bacterium]
MHKKIIFFVLIYIFAITAFSGDAIFINTDKEPSTAPLKVLGSEYFVRVDDLVLEGLTVHKTENSIFMVFQKDILEINKQDQYAKLNFLTKYKSSIVMENGSTHIKADLLAKFLKRSYISADGNMFFYSQLPKIVNMTYSLNKLTVETDSIAYEKCISFTSSGEQKIIRLIPFQNSGIVPKEIDLTSSGGMVTLKIKSTLDYKVLIQGKKIIIEAVSSSSDKSVYKPDDPVGVLSGYQQKIVTIGEQKVKCYYAKYDPKNYKIQPVVNNLGISSKFINVLSAQKPILAVNASYFDVSTLEPIGKIILNGRVLHIDSHLRPSFYIDKNGNPNMDYIKLEYTAYLDDIPLLVKSVNSLWKANIKVYTSEYKNSIKEGEDEYLFYLIQNGKVISTTKKSPSGNQLLLLVKREYEKYLTEIVIDSVFRYETNNDKDINVYHMVDGGPFLINTEFSKERLAEEKRGFSSIINGRTSRTLVAIDNDNMVTFIMVEGNQKDYPGLDYDGCIELLNQIGTFKKAMMFDGGSSCIFYADNKIINYREADWRESIPVMLGVFMK